VFTARYALSSYIKQIRLVFKGLICVVPGLIFTYHMVCTEQERNRSPVEKRVLPFVKDTNFIS
jgi:hypothetical protein